MCSECLQTPCHPRCPNAKEPRAVTDCCRCNGGIIPGDEYAIIDGMPYCESCLEDMPLSELVTLMGGEWLRATEDDLDDGTEW